MQGRKNKRLAHLMNAPGVVGRPRITVRKSQNRSNVNPEEDYRLAVVEYETPNSVKVSTSLSNVLKQNKASSFAPECQDFGQRTSTATKENRDIEEYEQLLLEQYGFELNPDSIVPADNIASMQGVNPSIFSKTKTSSQHVELPQSTTDRSTDFSFKLTEPGRWKVVDSPKEVESVLKKGRSVTQESKATAVSDKTTSVSRDIVIGKAPRVKVVAEKYTKFKNNNIEVRKLDEQIVCLEYDVFDKDAEINEPIETMRAYFSVSTGCEKCSDDCTLLNELLPELKSKIKGDEKETGYMRENEIEIINEKMNDNSTYVSDLRRVLLRKEALFAKKKKSSLDLNYLYDMAKMEAPPRDHDFSRTNLLSKNELEEVKELILENRVAPGMNIKRKTIRDCTKSSKDFKHRSRDEVILYELLTALEQK